MKIASVIICTRNRAKDLHRCLESFKPYYDWPALEILVVDNNHPPDKETEEVLSRYPVRVVHQAKPGLSKSLNLGIQSALGDIVVFTDDDVIVNERWLDRLLENFNEPNVAYVSGQVLPFVIETDAQRFFEMRGGLNKGQNRRDFDYHYYKSVRWRGVPVHRIAMGANSAARKKVLEEVGYFDEKFGVGGFIGAGNTGDICYRIMRSGYKVVYDPTAVIHHYHEPDYNKFKNKLYRYGAADIAQQTKFLIVYKDYRSLFEIFWIKPFYHFKRITKTLLGKSEFPMELIMAELKGNLMGPFLYMASIIYFNFNSNK